MRNILRASKIPSLKKGVRGFEWDAGLGDKLYSLKSLGFRIPLNKYKILINVGLLSFI